MRITPSQIIVLGFLCLILLGALLLMLPISGRAGHATSFLDALFTATSATCVTGLVVHDTATYWSLFGQIVILLLIQIGGMGFVTIAVGITVLRGKKIGLRQRFIMQESIGAFQVAGIVRMTSFIVKYVALCEGIGALLLATRFCPRYGFARGLWYAVFHSISAFCNAGFDLMGNDAPYSSLTAWERDPIINLTIMLLIIIGGIGFTTWADVHEHGVRFHAYRLQTKLVLVTTGVLLAAPLLFFLIYEFQLPQWAGLSASQKVWAALFQSVTPRTAGFNTVNLALLSEPSVLILILLMLVGGSPGSTAGGFKTTTLATVFLSVRSTLNRKDGIQAFGRRLEESVLSRATVLVFLYLAFSLSGAAAISILDRIPVLTAMFETASAIGTVGLTLGVTPMLSVPSHLILIFLMYFGRIGGLTMIYALAVTTLPSPVRMPQERVTIG
jgi:trk system potassium uptake protein TrkH